MESIIMGIGGAGIDQVNRMSIKIKGDFACIGSGHALSLSSIKRKLEVRPNRNHEKDIRGLLKGRKEAFLIGGLGGMTGSSIIPRTAKIAKEMGIDVNAFVIMPFSMEGESRKRKAEKALKDLKYSCQATSFRLDSYFKSHPDLSMEKCFEHLSGVIARKLKLPEMSRKEKAVQRIKILEARKREIQKTIRLQDRELERVEKSLSRLKG